MTTPPRNPEEPADDAVPTTAWDAIVADLSGQMDFGDLDERLRQQPHAGSTAEPSDAMIDDLLDEGSFEPPIPPPLRAPADLISTLSWAGVIGGPAVVIGGSLFGIGAAATGFGLIAFIGGFVGLVARMKDHHDHLDDGSNGAVV